jgi:hypothetical protein
MKRTLLTLLVLLIISTIVQAQCNNKLVDIAASQSGKDAVYVREFKVKLKAGNIKVPSPVGHFNTLLKEGVTYRFNVANARELEGKAILQIFDNNNLLGSTYDSEKKIDQSKFDFICKKTATYQVLMSFLEAKEGCAVGILSMLVDSSAIQEQAVDSTMEILYRDIPNPLAIEAPLKDGQQIELEIDNGHITKTDKGYEAYVGEQSQATITISIKDSSNRTIEQSRKLFNVEELPLPYLVFGNCPNGIIEENKILPSTKVYLKIPLEIGEQPYKLLSFTMTNPNFPDNYSGMGDQISTNQITLIDNSSYAIVEARVQHPNGKIITIKGRYIIE